MFMHVRECYDKSVDGEEEDEAEAIIDVRIDREGEQVKIVVFVGTLGKQRGRGWGRGEEGWGYER